MTDRTKLERLNANSRDPAESVNLDVSGTMGPDYLGQQTVDVPGHPMDREGVRSLLPENRPDSPEIQRMDTGSDLPVLLESDMRTDPTEGTQGHYSMIVSGECRRCGYDRLRETVHTMAGESQRVCMACEAIQDRRADDGYRMPMTDRERAEERREAGPKIGEVAGRDIIDLEPETGYGARVALVDDKGVAGMRKSDVSKLYWTLYRNGDVDLAREIAEQIEQGGNAVEFEVRLALEDVA